MTMALRFCLLILFALALCGCRTTEHRDSIYGGKPGRAMWADSWLYAKAPELIVEDWIPEKPEMAGKYVLIEFWHTFSPPSRRMIPHLNKWHETYKDELVVISISDEEYDVVKTAVEEAGITYYNAVDTQARTHDKLNVFGLPHVIIVEPEWGCVIWEGYPLLKGYELTESTIQEILAVGRKRRKTR